MNEIIIYKGWVITASKLAKNHYDAYNLKNPKSGLFGELKFIKSEIDLLYNYEKI